MPVPVFEVVFFHDTATEIREESVEDCKNTLKNRFGLKDEDIVIEAWLQPSLHPDLPENILVRLSA